MAAARTVKRFLSYSSGTPFQAAIAVGLGLPDEFYTGIADTLRYKRDISVRASARPASTS